MEPYYWFRMFLEQIFQKKNTYTKYIMKKTDILFKDITNDKESCSRDFCYIGWEGTGSFAFWKYAEAYFKSAEVLFDKFKTSTGNNFVLDSMGITMCFLYRHFVELTIKYLFVRYVCKTEQEYKTFLNIGHNLHDLWQSVKPKLKELKKRQGDYDDYIKFFNAFGTAFKEGIYEDFSNKEEVAGLSLFYSTNSSSKLTTLDEYITVQVN